LAVTLAPISDLM